ncbi:hypothetical protein ACFLSI_05735 [Bacteroidota bacterium]
MKTNNIYSRIKLLIAGLALLLISGNVYSQKAYKQSDFSKLFTNIKERVRLIPADAKESKNLMLASPEVNFEEADDLMIEDWMLDDNYFKTKYALLSEEYFLTEDGEEEDKLIESWMLDDNYFDTPISQNIKPGRQ